MPRPGHGQGAFKSERLQPIGIQIRTTHDGFVPIYPEEACGYLVNGWAEPAPLLGLEQGAQITGSSLHLLTAFGSVELVGPSVTPEEGVTRYEHDHTQGPACAITAGAAAIYPKYFVPVGAQIGQSSEHQLDGLADLGAALSDRLGCPVADLWQMQNGYALASRTGLVRSSALLLTMDEAASIELAGHLRIGLHRDVEVTDGPSSPGPLSSQAFCSALPVAYGRVAQPHWQGFAQLVLDAAYETTLWAAVLNSRQGGSNTVLLTMLGGGAFGNATEWIHAAIERALKKVLGHGLDVRLVSYGRPSARMRALGRSYV